MHCLDEKRMEILIRRSRRVHIRPLVQEMEIVAVDVIDTVHCLSEPGLVLTLQLGFLTNARLHVRLVFQTHCEAHVLDQFASGFISRQAKQFRGEPDHVTFFLTSETDEVLIDLHAWIPVIMERTAHHAVPADFVAVMLRDFAGADLFFYR